MGKGLLEKPSKVEMVYLRKALGKCTRVRGYGLLEKPSKVERLSVRKALGWVN